MNETETSRAIWTCFESVKDVVKTNLYTSMKSGAVKLDQATYDSVMSLVLSSMDAGFHRAVPSVVKSIVK